MTPGSALPESFFIFNLYIFTCVGFRVNHSIRQKLLVQPASPAESFFPFKWDFAADRYVINMNYAGSCHLQLHILCQ